MVHENNFHQGKDHTVVNIQKDNFAHSDDGTVIPNIVIVKENVCRSNHGSNEPSQTLKPLSSTFTPQTIMQPSMNSSQTRDIESVAGINHDHSFHSQQQTNHFNSHQPNHYNSHQPNHYNSHQPNHYNRQWNDSNFGNHSNNRYRNDAMYFDDRYVHRNYDDHMQYGFGDDNSFHKPRNNVDERNGYGDDNSFFKQHRHLGERYADDEKKLAQKDGTTVSSTPVRKDYSSLTESSKGSSSKRNLEETNLLLNKKRKQDNSDPSKSVSKSSMPSEVVGESSIVLKSSTTVINQNDPNDDIVDEDCVSSNILPCNLIINSETLDDLLSDFGIPELFHNDYKPSWHVATYLSTKSRSSQITQTLKIIKHLKNANVLNRSELWNKDLLNRVFFVHDANMIQVTRHTATVVRCFNKSRTSIDDVYFRIDIDSNGLGFICVIDTLVKLIDKIINLPISQMYHKFDAVKKERRLASGTSQLKDKTTICKYSLPYSTQLFSNEGKTTLHNPIASQGFSHFFKSKSNSSLRSNFVSSSLKSSHDLSIFRQRLQIKSLGNAGSIFHISKKDKFIASSLANNVVQTLIDSKDLLSTNKLKEKKFFLGGAASIQLKFPIDSEVVDIHAIPNVKKVETVKGCICYNHNDLVFILLPRKESIKMKRPQCYINALKDIEKNYTMKKSDRGQRRTVVFESDHSNYVSIGVADARAKRGLYVKGNLTYKTSSRLDKVGNFIKHACQQYISTCIFKALNTSFDKIGMTDFRNIGNNDDCISKSSNLNGKAHSFIPTFAFGKDTCLELHKDEDTFLSILSLHCSNDVCRNTKKYKLKSKIVKYFVFDNNVVVGLRSGDVLIFNPQIHHCVSTKTIHYSDIDVYCVSHYFKAKITGMNDNSIVFHNDKK
jgi:hypothetical protein